MRTFVIEVNLFFGNETKSFEIFSAFLGNFWIHGRNVVQYWSFFCELFVEIGGVACLWRHKGRLQCSLKISIDSGVYEL